MKLESEPKGPRAFRSAKVKVTILDKIVQLKTFWTNSRWLVMLKVNKKF